jgi:glycosyltransferase involved in cell wall biosynthesis
MLNKPLISIIIPIYNSELHLSKCIESVINQSYKNYELILVNDGSSDSSRVICENYAISDTRIKVFNKTNEGVSSTRNLGLQNATGKFIVFIDSDDYIDNYFLEELLNYSDYDLVFESAKIFDENGIREQKLNFREIIADDFNQMTNFFPEIDLSTILGAPWGKLFNKHIIDEFNIRFKKQYYYGEDKLFVLEYLSHCNNYIQLSALSYNYFYSYKFENKKYHLSFEYIIDWINMCLFFYDQISENWKSENNLDFQRNVEKFIVHNITVAVFLMYKSSNYYESIERQKSLYKVFTNNKFNNAFKYENCITKKHKFVYYNYILNNPKLSDSLFLILIYFLK